MSKVCIACGAKCCKYFCFEIDEPEDYAEFENIRWFLCHEGISVHIDEGDWFISIDNRCKMLTPDNRCGIYEDRPLICRQYKMENCDEVPGGYDYDMEFHTPEQIERYARKVLGVKKYEQARAKARRKVDRRARKGTKRKKVS